MTAMKYILTPSQRTFKEAVRSFLKSEIPSLRKATGGRIAAGGMVHFGDDFPRAGAAPGKGRTDFGVTESVVALEEISRAASGVAAKFGERAVFTSPSPALGRAAANLGSAEGILAPRLAKRAPPEDSSPAGPFQELMDLVSAIECARLTLFRAAVQEDAGKADPRRAEAVEQLSAGIKSRAEAVLEEFKKGESDET
jgi:hypothetical protein